MQRIPSRGHWAFEVRKNCKTIVTPGTKMRVERIVLPMEVRPTDSPDDLGYMCRLLCWRSQAGLAGGGVGKEGAVIAGLLPEAVENWTSIIALLPGEVYTFELGGGGLSLHLSGRFNEDDDPPSKREDCPITEIRLIAGRAATASVGAAEN